MRDKSKAALRPLRVAEEGSENSTNSSHFIVFALWFFNESRTFWIFYFIGDNNYFKYDSSVSNVGRFATFANAKWLNE